LLIELMPVIAKTLLPAGVYDEKVRLRQQVEAGIAESNAKKEQELKELYNQMAFEQDQDFIKAFFDESQVERRQKLGEELQQWKKEGGSFDSFWLKIKRDMLTKQEG
jgi:hypothetical protein